MMNNTMSSQHLSEAENDPSLRVHHFSSSDHPSLIAKGDARTSMTTIAQPDNNGIRLGHQKEGNVSENERLLDNTDTRTLQARPDPPSSFSGEAGTSTKTVGELDRDSLSTEAAIWRPFWLRPVIIGTFGGSLVIIMVALSAMTIHSNNNKGLGTFKPGSEFVWRFASTGGEIRVRPTAAASKVENEDQSTNYEFSVLAIVAGLWARVELQAGRYTPWMNLHHRKPMGHESYRIDYPSMNSVKLIILSFQRKDYLVFLVTIVAILLKIQIVLVPGLYQLDQVRVIEPVDLHILDAFQTPDNPPDQYGYEADTSKFHLSRALHNFNMSYPFGVTQNLSYQRFEPRGSPTKPIKVVVDAAISEIQCLKLQAYSVYKVQLAYNRIDDRQHDVDLSLDFEGCRNVSLRFSHVSAPYKSDGFTDLWQINSTLTPARPCQNLPQQGRQFIYFAGTIGQSPSKSSLPDVVNATAIICTPLTRLSKVQVTDDGINPIVDSVSQDFETPSDVDMWAMLAGSIPQNYDWRWSQGPRSFGPVEVWGMFNETTVDSMSSSLDDNKLMYESVIGLASHMDPLIAHYRLGIVGLAFTQGRG
ncbi:hypothetical protein CcaCcLH18_03990 [Colletotrichum camelliae]|nr:hypothetical protein CcaCcLH18_03990 [Colletotrichum camelliae]